MIKGFHCVAFVAFLAACTQGTPDERQPALQTHDGRFDSECNARSGVTNKPFCRISFYQLLGNVERYDQKDVEFVGYVGTVTGVRYAFPNEEALRHWDLSSAIRLEGDFAFPDGWASVSGKYYAKEDPRKDMYLGRLRNVRLDRL